MRFFRTSLLFLLLVLPEGYFFVAPAAEEAQGVRVEEGDALLLRLGWYRRRLKMGPPPAPDRPGLHVASMPWVHERGVSILAADASEDVVPSGYPGNRQPVHKVGQVAMGLWLIDAGNFEDIQGVFANPQESPPGDPLFAVYSRKSAPGSTTATFRPPEG